MWGKNNIQIVSVIPSSQSIRNRAPFLPSHVTNTSWHWLKLPGPSQHVPCCLCCGRVCSPTCWRPKDRKGFERWSQLIHQHVHLSQQHAKSNPSQFRSGMLAAQMKTFPNIHNSGQKVAHRCPVYTAILWLFLGRKYFSAWFESILPKPPCTQSSEDIKLVLAQFCLKRDAY